MSALGSQNRAFLFEKFRERVTFDSTERKLYSHDIAVTPSLIKPLIGSTVPNAIVQPQTEEELAELARWAARNCIPLTPRGKSSSGYGGVLPIKKGIVVDFYRMNQVVSIDTASHTATVQAGIVWEKLDRELEKQGLMLRLYPTSYPGSTVGGWLAQGGVGIGSYEAGWFRDNVVSARLVLADGTVKDHRGEDLELVADAEGITGLISEITLRVQPLENLEVVAIGCPDAHDNQHMLEAMIEKRLPIWSLVFINPRMAELKNKAPLREHAGHPAEERVLLPAAYITTIAFRARDAGEIMKELRKITKPCQAEILPDKIARHEWQNRFRLMVVKRLGPSLVPAEVIVPLSALGDVMQEIENKVNQPIVKEGVVIREGPAGKPEVVILGFIPSDQRGFSYNFVFSLVLTIVKIAEKYGGRPYSTGLYFANKARKVLGTNKAAKLKKFKREVDPRGIMNPGKVLGGGMLGRAIGLASFFEPMIRPFGNYVITKIGERPSRPVRGIPADVAWYAYSCSQCGYCVDECDQFYGRGWESQSPRGKWYWLREFMEGRAQWNQQMVDTIIACTTCELCNLRCSAALPIEPAWMKLRGKLISDDKKLTFPPFEMMAAALHSQGNIWAGYRKDRSDWFPKDLLEKHGPGTKSRNVYFAGCTASYVERDIGIAGVRLLDTAGVDFTYLGTTENCCGTPMLVAGKWELFAETMKKNIDAVKATGADSVISSCPACDMMWRQVYPAWSEKIGIEYGIVAKHYTEVVAEKIKSGEFRFPESRKKSVTVTWHDSCHIGRASGVYDPPRDLIAAIPDAEFVEMSHNRENAHCCGSVLTLLKDPDVAASVGKTRLDEAVEAGAKMVLALCPCCQFQLRVSAEAKGIPIEIVDLARFASEALGYELPDPHPEVRAQWAVFKMMIELMTPQGFVNLMSTMWPEIIASMPFGMGRMMRFAGKLPGVLTLMKPLFPVLFPVLMPKMLEKLMPTLLERMAERIPMPDYMVEQMPELMPQVMEALMPYMIGDIARLARQPLINYLRGKPVDIVSKQP